MFDADEARDTHSLNEFLAQPKLSEEVKSAQWLAGIHPDQVEPKYLVFSMKINGNIDRYSLPILEGDMDGRATESSAEALASSMNAESLYHGFNVFRREFKNQPEGIVLGG